MLSKKKERRHHACQCADLGTWGCSRLLLGHQFVTLIGSPASASSPPLVHRSATKLNPKSSGGVTWGYSTNRTLGHQFVTLIGSPASASSPPLVHRSATKLNPTSSRMAYGNPFTVSRFLNSSRSAHSNGRLKGPCAATIPDKCRTTTRSTLIILTGNGITGIGKPPSMILRRPTPLLQLSDG